MGFIIKRNNNPQQMAKLQGQLSKLVPSSVLQQMGGMSGLTDMVMLVFTLDVSIASWRNG